MLYKFTQSVPKGQAIGATIAGVMGLSYVVFASQRYIGSDFGGARPNEPKTTNEEWQAASVEYAKVQKANPIRHFRG